MPELVILGTAASVPDAEHDTVALVLRGLEWAVLIECSGSSLYKLAQVGIPRDHLSAVILTHRHADHVYGLPMLVQGAWLGGRTAPLPIYGPQETLDIGLQTHGSVKSIRPPSSPRTRRSSRQHALRRKRLGARTCRRSGDHRQAVDGA